MIDYKQLESIRGFLVYQAMTYEVLFPYLKGFHLTLSQHLPHRDEEGWKLKGDCLSQYLDNKLAHHLLSEQEVHDMKCQEVEQHHVQVRPVPLFWACLKK